MKQRLLECGIVLMALLACKEDGETKKEPAKAVTPASASAAAAKSAPTPKTKPKPVDPKTAIMGKWVGDSIEGKMPFKGSKIEDLRLLVNKTEIVRANPDLPVARAKYTVKKVDGTKVYVEMAGVPGEMYLEVNKDGKLVLGQKGIDAKLLYRRGDFAVKPVMAAAKTKQPWKPPAADKVAKVKPKAADNKGADCVNSGLCTGGLRCCQLRGEGVCHIGPCDKYGMAELCSGKGTCPSGYMCSEDSMCIPGAFDDIEDTAGEPEHLPGTGTGSSHGDEEPASDEDPPEVDENPPVTGDEDPF